MKKPNASRPAERHISREALGLYVLGDLSVRATLAAEEHLALCSRCQATLPQMEAVIAALRAPASYDFVPA